MPFELTAPFFGFVELHIRGIKIRTGHFENWESLKRVWIRILGGSYSEYIFDGGSKIKDECMLILSRSTIIPRRESL